MAKVIQMSDGDGNVYPVGATIGSNSNGHYIKFADGTLIQYGISVLTAPGSMSAASGVQGLYWATFTLTLPIAFVDNDYSIIATTRYQTGHPFACGSVPASETIATIAAYDFYARPNNDGTRKFFWQAIGRWK